MVVKAVLSLFAEWVVLAAVVQELSELQDQDQQDHTDQMIGA